MTADYIEIDGRKYRVEANWNAMVAFLAATGRDTWDGLVSFDHVLPSDLAPLAAACINEGERIDGHDCHFSAEDLGAMLSVRLVSEFLPIYTSRRLRMLLPRKGAKKKTEGA